jgi:hypothetical protein
MAQLLPKFLGLILLLTSSQLLAVTDAQLASIKALGAINGVALSCKRLDQTQRMKQAVVTSLPKIRYLGDAFDQASNDAYLAFLGAAKLCPTKSAFSSQVTEAIDVLKNQFPKKK